MFIIYHTDDLLEEASVMSKQWIICRKSKQYICQPVCIGMLKIISVNGFVWHADIFHAKIGKKQYAWDNLEIVSWSVNYTYVIW